MKVLFLCVLLACLAFCMTRAEMEETDDLGFVELEERKPASKKPAAKRPKRSDDDNLAFAEDIARRARTKGTARRKHQ